jgi:histidinol phosphatase-like PHP family hydrolase
MAKKKNHLDWLPDVFFGGEVAKLQEEAHEIGLSTGIMRGIDTVIATIHHRSGLSAEQIVEITHFNLDFVKSILSRIDEDGSLEFSPLKYKSRPVN